MENLSLEKFNPTKAELQELQTKYSGLVIKDINDEEGYIQVVGARKELQKKRIAIQKAGKAMREEAIQFQKSVIAFENDLVNVIEPLEKKLKQMQDDIDLEKEKAKRLGLLPDRKSRLIDIEVDVSDDEILSMDDVAFEAFFNEKKYILLCKKEEEQKLEQQRLEDEKKKIEEERVRKEQEEQQKLEQEKLLKEAQERAIKEAEEKAKLEIENAKKKAEEDKLEALKKAEDEKRAIIEEQERKEKARIEEEVRKKIEEENKIRIEKEEQEKLEKQKKYQSFLKDNNYNELTDKLVQKDNITLLYRKIAEFNNINK